MTEILPQHRVAPSAREERSRGGKPGLFLSAICLALLASVGHAADAPTAPPPAPSTMTRSPPKSPDAALADMADRIAQDGNATVVSVGGQTITSADVADGVRALPSMLIGLGFNVLYKRVVDQLISEKLAMLSAVKLGLDKDPDVRRRQRTASERALADAWINREADTAVTEVALRARYDRDIAGSPGPIEVRTRVILVATEAQALTLIGKIQGGAGFDDLAREFSKDGSASMGGDLGYVPFEALAPEAAAIAFVLAPGQMTAFPVRTQAGYFILRVEGRRQRATPAFDEVREHLVRELRREAALAAVRGLTADMKPGEPPKP